LESYENLENLKEARSMQPAKTIRIEVKLWVLIVAAATILACIAYFVMENDHQAEEIDWWRKAALSRRTILIDEDTVPGSGIVYFEGGDKALVFSKRTGDSFFIDFELRRLDNGKIVDTR